jgi:hypothetical protein
MTITIRWRNPWLRVVVYAIGAILLGLGGSSAFQFIYQGF